MGRNRTTITNTIRLLRLPEHVQRKVAAGVITPGHARAVLSVVDPELMDRLVDKIVVEDLNGARRRRPPPSGSPGPAKQKKATGRRNEGGSTTSRTVSGSRFDTRVRVDLNAKSGRIVIDFGSVQDLNRILKRSGRARLYQLATALSGRRPRPARSRPTPGRVPRPRGPAEAARSR